jgi:hypothetical protein
VWAGFVSDGPYCDEEKILSIASCFQNLPEHILSDSDEMFQLHNKDQ